MTDALHGAHPDARAECPRCGALVRVAMVGRHDRDHEWDDQLLQRVTALENGAGAEVVEWPSDAGDGIEPDEALEIPADGVERTHRFG